MAIGISLSDWIYVSLSILGMAKLLEDPEIRLWMGIIGTILLIFYGVYSWMKSPRIYHNKPITNGHFTTLKYLAKGFFLNGLNPFVVVFWIGLISVVTARFNYAVYDQVYFFIGVLITILTTDLSKGFIAHRLKFLITPRIVLRFNRIVGTILILFGLRIVYFLIDNYWITSFQD